MKPFFLRSVALGAAVLSIAGVTFSRYGHTEPQSSGDMHVTHVKAPDVHVHVVHDYTGVPAKVDIGIVPIRKEDRTNLNMAWIAVMKSSYEDGRVTLSNQTSPHCLTKGRPHGQKIFIPETCYMVPVRMYDDHDRFIAGDTLLIGRDDIISMKPRYRVGDDTVLSMTISNENGDYNQIPYAAMNTVTYNRLARMAQEVREIIQNGQKNLAQQASQKTPDSQDTASQKPAPKEIVPQETARQSSAAQAPASQDQKSVNVH